MIDPEFYNTVSPAAAVIIQKKLREKIDLSPLTTPINYIGGADISFNKFEETVYAGIVVLKYPELTIHSQVSATCNVKFPYRTGLLAFREIPAVLKVWNLLTTKPDVLVMDGHGIAHPRRLGIATHFGIITNRPTIGCGKSRLTGSFTEPANERFAATALVHHQEQIGFVLRTKRNCKPVFVSPGYKISLKQSLQIIENCSKGYRIPEPTRLAHLLVNEERKNNPSSNSIIT